jgi:hypothetical protein
MLQPVTGRISFFEKEMVGQGIFEEVTRYRIKTMGSPRVAAGDPFGCQPDAKQRAMKLYRIDGIDGTGWKMPASARKQRRDQVPVKINQPNEGG